MKKRSLILASLCLALTLSAFVPERLIVYASESTESEVEGEMAFARCEEYINIRNGADMESDITAKIYNNGAVRILSREGDWYKIRSGNAEGYVKAEYFVTGDEAKQIAEKVAYNVATVYPEHLNIRTGPSEDYGLVDVAEQHDELEVVAYDGAWMKVALGNDVYGYVNAYYVGYDTYYPVAETLEEEQIRLREEQKAAEAITWEEEYAQEDTWTDESVPEDTWTEESVTEDTWTEESVPEDTWTDDSVTEDTWTEESVPEDTWTDENVTEDTWTDENVTEDTWTEESIPEDTWTEESVPEDTWTEESVPEDTWTEESVPEDTWTEESVPEDSTQEQPSVSTGSDIAGFATQFVGNPYVWGGTSLTNGADCSGFVQSVMANFGIYISRTAASQANGGTAVSMENIQAGDLVFYSSGGEIDHVGLYIGGGQIVHAANSNSGIIISNCYYNAPVSVRRYW